MVVIVLMSAMSDIDIVSQTEMETEVTNRLAVYFERNHKPRVAVFGYLNWPVKDVNESFLMRWRAVEMGGYQLTFMPPVPTVPSPTGVRLVWTIEATLQWRDGVTAKRTVSGKSLTVLHGPNPFTVQKVVMSGYSNDYRRVLQVTFDAGKRPADRAPPLICVDLTCKLNVS